MVNGCANAALRQVARVFHEGTLTGLSDREMLARFVEGQDGAAFEVLVARHGPMVFNVCRQVLRDPRDVEDAFQAVFLVLVRKASTIRVEGSLGPWLYTVANRVAARTRANQRRIGLREISAVAAVAESPGKCSLERLEAAVVIQEELARLPERLRAPLVLCYLQGMTHELAAVQLGCPVGTVRSRLSRGRAQLLTQITRRGLTLSAAGLVSALESNAGVAAVPPIVRFTLIKLATSWISESAATVGGIETSASVAALLEGVLNVMRIKKLAIVATGLVGMGALGLVIADRAAAVGGSQTQESLPRRDDPVIRQVGPIGRTGELAPAEPQPDSDIDTKTYYVGDILETTQRVRPGSNLPGKSTGAASGERLKVDMSHLINFLITTVAPGTWENRYDTRWDAAEMALGIAVPNPDGNTVTNKPTGSIIPFHLSISLIVKCSPEVHKQFAITLRGLRQLLMATDNGTVQQQPPEQPKTSPIPSGDPTLQAPKAPLANPAVPAPRQRVQQLLDELQKEIEKLPPDKEQSPTVLETDSSASPRTQLSDRTKPVAS